MNILTDVLPESVTIGNREYQIDTDFRASLRIMMAFEDNELTPQEKQIILLSNLYPVIPDDLQGASEQAGWFLNCGVEAKEESDSPRLYSFSKDANFIFAAFQQTHGIDLSTTNMHWWKFYALFMDLGSETTWSQLVGLRKRILTGKATKEERAAARDMGEIVDVPQIDDRTLEEKEREAKFLELVAKGKHK